MDDPVLGPMRRANERARGDRRNADKWEAQVEEKQAKEVTAGARREEVYSVKHEKRTIKAVEVIAREAAEPKYAARRKKAVDAAVEKRGDKPPRFLGRSLLQEIEVASQAAKSRRAGIKTMDEMTGTLGAADKKKRDKKLAKKAVAKSTTSANVPVAGPSGTQPTRRSARSGGENASSSQDGGPSRPWNIDPGYWKRDHIHY
jgi:colicin import membrane protein